MSDDALLEGAETACSPNANPLPDRAAVDDEILVLRPKDTWIFPTQEEILLP